MKNTLTQSEIIQMRERLRSRLDYIIAILLWVLFFFSFVSIWAIGSLEPIHAGFALAFQESPIFLLFPAFASFGMISDRILINDLLKYSVEGGSVLIPVKTRRNGLNREDYFRIFLSILILFISLPWLAARLGIARILFFQPVHLGEHHGFIGIYILLAILLISKTEKLYLNSIFKELTIFGLCFASIWGAGLVVNDFALEQLNFNFPFWVWDWDPNSLIWFAVQLCVILGLTSIIYYFGWRKYYRKKQ